MEDLAFILNIAIEEIEKVDLKTFPSLIGRLAGVFLSAFKHDLDRALTILIRRGKLQIAMKTILGNLKIYLINEYDSRLFVNCLSSVLA